MSRGPHLYKFHILAKKWVTEVRTSITLREACIQVWKASKNEVRIPQTFCSNLISKCFKTNFNQKQFQLQKDFKFKFNCRVSKFLKTIFQKSSLSNSKSYFKNLSLNCTFKSLQSRKTKMNSQSKTYFKINQSKIN